MSAAMEVKSAGANVQASAVSTIVLGFAADPMTRWVWPDSSEYLRIMPRFVKAFGGRAFEHGTAYITEGVRAAALWLPPGVEPDAAAMGSVMEETLRPEIAEDVGAIMKGMAESSPRAALVSAPYRRRSELDRARARRVAHETRSSTMRRGGHRGLPRKHQPS